MGELIDKVMLESLQGLLADKFDELINVFIDDCQARFMRLSSAVLRGEFEEIRAEAHGIKGSCRNIGANSLADICALIEDKGRHSDATGLKQDLASAKQQFAAVSEQLRDYL
ncbi:Hpt domain-containing protein [Agaribacterium sp. ZY112]|uniref:Hpt domain-containing protein n=1 Tax=Agaribacterium sp. ZY112 TaxID=3233574 RepID=UPI003523E1FF